MHSIDEKSVCCYFLSHRVVKVEVDGSITTCRLTVYVDL